MALLKVPREATYEDRVRVIRKESPNFSKRICLRRTLRKMEDSEAIGLPQEYAELQKWVGMVTLRVILSSFRRKFGPSELLSPGMPANDFPNDMGVHGRAVEEIGP